jgi:hypothetical protein
MKLSYVSLSIGRNNISPKIARWDVELMEGTGPLVELIALGELDPLIQHPLEKRQAATTLAIHMDPKVAIELSQHIRDLARTKGWPLPPEDETRV